MTARRFIPAKDRSSAPDNGRASRRRGDRTALGQLGERSVVDLVAPASLEQHRAHVQVDDQLLRVLAVTEYPRYVYPNWLARLIDFDAPLELVLHLEPLDSAVTIRRLTRKLVELQSSRLLDARGGRIADAEREVAYGDVERLRDALQRSEERVFSAGLYLLLRGRTPAALDDLGRRVETALGGMLAASRPATFEHLPGLRSCLPAGRDELRRRRNLDTTSAATMLPFASGHLSMDRGLLYGVGVHSHSLVIVDPFSRALENANKVVFAKSGAGKSDACKVEALRALLLGIEYHVIDPEDEYRRICAAVEGQYLRLSGSSPQHINPFDLPPADGSDGLSRDALAEKVLALQGLLGLMLADRGATLGQQEKEALDAALYETYRLDRPFVVFGVRDLEPELRPLGVYLIAEYLWRPPGAASPPAGTPPISPRRRTSASSPRPAKSTTRPSWRAVRRRPT
jgi:hypothetical protein